MTKANFRPFFVAAIAAVFLLLAGGRAMAQAGMSDNLLTLPAANYVTYSEATPILTDHCMLIKGVLVTLTPGSPAYKTAERSYSYFNTILNGVVNGKDVPNSIKDGLSIFTTARYGDTPKTQIQSLKQEAITLLSN